VRTKLFTLLSRIGSVLLTVGLAFLLTAMVPPVPTGSYSVSTSYFPGPERFYTKSFSHQTMSPKLGIRVSVETNCSLELYLLDWERLELNDMVESWVRSQYPTLNETQVHLGVRNMSVLEGFLQDNPGHVLLQDTVLGGQFRDFFPTRKTNITVILVNPSPDQTRCITTLRLETITTIIPRDPTIAPSLTLIAFGVLLQLASATSTRFFGRTEPSTGPQESSFPSH
jgi:hypothetical protein